jgi:hypothetical protein
MRTRAALLAFLCFSAWAAPFASAQTPSATPFPTPQAVSGCNPSLRITDLPANQSDYYGPTRSFQTLKSNYTTSFPNLAYFTGLNCVRYTGSALMGTPPSYIAPCSAASGGTAPKLDISVPKPESSLTTAQHDIEIAFRDIRTLAYRLRTCDFMLSIIAWNTMGRGLPAQLTYSWQVGCNSFLNESGDASTLTFNQADKNYVVAAAALANAPTDKQAAAAFASAYTAFVFARYDEYDDLNQRLQACAAVVTSYAYPANKARFFCNYGGLIGALLTGSATAFGKHWGATSSSTQAQVQGLGTVFIAFPALCSK